MKKVKISKASKSNEVTVLTFSTARFRGDLQSASWLYLKYI